MSDQIPTNLRLLRLLEEVARAGAPVTPTSVNAALGLPKPTLHRLFATAEAEGFLVRDHDGRRYSPGTRLVRLSIGTLSAERPQLLRRTVLQDLAAKVGETCNLAVPDDDGMFYLDRVETHWPLRIQLPAGSRVPFHCTASGKIYLSSLRSDYFQRFLKNHVLERQTAQTLTDSTVIAAEIAATRARGYALDNEEFMDGMTAIAVPIRNADGRFLFSLSIHAPEQRRSVEDLVTQLEVLKEAAKRLGEMVSPVL